MGKIIDFIKDNKKTIITLVAIVLIVVLLCLFIFKLDNWLLSDYNSLNNPDIYDDMRSVNIDGQEYLPKDMSTYLFIGIDKNTKIEVSTTTTEQADFILLLICNHKDKTITALHINRDTLTQVKMLSQFNGNVIGTEEWQITLAHTYGLDESQRSLNTLDAFRSLMKNLPVTQYISFTMPIVPSIVEAVGEINITITEDAANHSLGYDTGDVVTLTKDNALDFVRTREDNIGRMARQKLFMNEVLNEFKTSKIKYEDYLDEIADYVYTNISDAEFENLNNYIKDYSFNGIKTLNGESSTKKVAGKDYATYIVQDSTINDFLVTYCYDLRK